MATRGEQTGRSETLRLVEGDPAPAQDASAEQAKRVVPAGEAAAAPVKAAEAPARRGLKPRSLILPIILLAGLGGAGWYGYGWWTHGRFMVTTDDAYLGVEQAVVSSKLAANVAAVPVAANQRVKAGDPLVVLDDSDLQLALRSARARLETQQATLARFDSQIAAAGAAITQAQAQMVSANADLTRAQSDFDRAAKLASNDFGSRATLDKATADRDRASAVVTSAEAGIVAAKANVLVVTAQKAEAESVAKELAVAVEKAEHDLSFTTIRAPFDGVIANKAVQVGDYVTPGKRLSGLVPLDRLYLDANLKETQLAKVMAGEKAEVVLDAYPDKVFEATVVDLAPGTGSVFTLLPPDNATGNFTKIVQRVAVRLKFSDAALAEGVLRPGLSATVSIDTRTAPAR